MPAKLKVSKDDITLKDIAEVVGKSVAAVSRALNDYDDIGEETRAYIKQVAKEMGYSPNPMAQRLQKRATDTLGLILPAFSPKDFEPFFSELLAGIANEAAEYDFDWLVSTCIPGPAENQAYQRLIAGRRVDGIIVARPRWQDDRIELLQQKQFPFVVVGTSGLPGNIPAVIEDATEGARLAVEHLVQHAHKRIALVNAADDLIYSSDFFAGFRQAMIKAELSINDDFLEYSDFSQKEGYRAAQTLLSRPETPSAIITADDIVGLGVMAAAQDQGFEIGHDLAVTGYGDILLSEYSQPPLTTLHRPTYLMGQHACRMLISLVQGETLEQQQIEFKPSLVIRQSSDLALWL